MNISEFYSAIKAISERIRHYRENEAELSDQEKNEIAFIEDLRKAYGFVENGEKYLKKIVEKTNYYHYTDLHGLLGIFKNYIDSGGDNNKVRYCTMRASHVRFLNDSQEYKEGEKCYTGFIKHKQVRQEIDKYTNSNYTLSTVLGDLKDAHTSESTYGAKQLAIGENIYSISFCGNGNLLSQWKYYGKNSGIAIEFNFDDAKCFVGEFSSDFKQKNEADELSVCPLKIAYTDVEKLALFAMSCLTPDADGRLLTQYPQEDIFIPFCKNESFMEECESRLAFSPDNVKCKYVVSDGKIKPYIPITFLAKEGTNIIDSITVGPGENQNLIYNALIHIFDSKKFHFQEDNSDQNTSSKNVPYPCQNGVKIKKSEIPFRG